MVLDLFPCCGQTGFLPSFSTYVFYFLCFYSQSIVNFVVGFTDHFVLIFCAFHCYFFFFFHNFRFIAQKSREGLALPAHESNHWNRLNETVPMVPSNLALCKIGGQKCVSSLDGLDGY